MRGAQTVIRSFLLFFFLVSIFSGVTLNQGLLGKIIAGILFGVLMMLVPTILGFFKLPTNWGAMFLLSLVISFLYFFLLKTGAFGLGSVGASVINWGTPLLGTWRLDDLTTLVLVSVTSALGSVWMESNLKKK